MNEAAAPTFFPFIMLLVFFLFVYFVTIRPQQKRQKAHADLVKSLAAGDEVMTSGGLLAKVISVNEHYANIEISKAETEVAELANKAPEKIQKIAKPIPSLEPSCIYLF